MGSIVKRKDKGGKVKYGARAYIGYKEGVREYKWLGTFASERDAKRAIRDVESAKDTGASIPTGKVTFGHYMRDWLRDKELEVRWGTYRNERLGHAQTSITMNIYAHTNDKQQQHAADSFASAIFGA